MFRVLRVVDGLLDGGGRATTSSGWRPSPSWLCRDADVRVVLTSIARRSRRRAVQLVIRVLRPLFHIFRTTTRRRRIRINRALRVQSDSETPTPETFSKHGRAGVTKKLFEPPALSHAYRQARAEDRLLFAVAYGHSPSCLPSSCGAASPTIPSRSGGRARRPRRGRGRLREIETSGMWSIIEDAGRADILCPVRPALVKIRPRDLLR